jgi:hypothetical protein
MDAMTKSWHDGGGYGGDVDGRGAGCQSGPVAA